VLRAPAVVTESSVDSIGMRTRLMRVPCEMAGREILVARGRQQSLRGRSERETESIHMRDFLSAVEITPSLCIDLDASCA
jgi:hypothetical protein